MSKVRSDDLGGIFFHRADGQWTDVEFHFLQGVSDGTNEVLLPRVVAYRIADLPSSVLTPLAQAWAALQTYRDTLDPIQ